MTKPELKQFGELMAADFDRNPVWISCHTADHDEPWYNETDEETFRPWTGELPVSPADGMFLVRATLALREGGQYPGFVTPAFEEADLGAMQPQIFVGSRRFSFWGGAIAIPTEDRQAFYTALGKRADLIFPLRFSANPGLATGVVAGQVHGFYKTIDKGKVGRVTIEF
jgi:hypothetical protein